MRLTVAICTWNRARLLDQALAAMRGVQVPAGTEWELLIVNNNCTDNTEEVAARHAASLPLRTILEANQGKSYALNRAAVEASGSHIIWTDDDAKVGEGWLRSYVEAFERWPEAAFFGGPVRPWFEEGPPAWLARVIAQAEGAYAILDYGAESFEFTPQKVPYGINMAVRIEEQRNYLYDPKLGPRPQSQVRGEETALVRAMMADGLKGRWVPGAVVEHHVPLERQKTSYLRHFYRGLGEVEGLGQDEDLPTLLGKPRWLWRAALLGEIEYRRKRLLGSPEQWIEPLIRSSRAWGRLFGSRSGLR